MNIELTKDVEQKRIQNSHEYYSSLQKTKKSTGTTWEYYSGPSIVEAVRQARDMGWKEKKVQVRYEEGPEGTTFYIEPYEKGCGCKGLLKYRDFFD